MMGIIIFQCMIKPMWAVSGSPAVLLLPYCRSREEVSEGSSLPPTVVPAVQLRKGKISDYKNKHSQHFETITLLQNTGN
jgi:hypothetical protein